jgi:peptidoglycan hydrolase-like protein with peptidoglycan-binding domain
MPYSLTWLPEVLRGAGLKVAEVPGWVDRGAGEMGVVRGVICHHTAVQSQANMPTLHALIGGRKDPPLSGPLAQLGLARDGTYYVVAAGRANHAGKGSWRGITGNSSFIGIEAENSGAKTDLWPDVQMDAYRRGVAAILTRIGADVEMCCGHKEYAPGRKDDPSFDMDQFRVGVRAILRGTVSTPQLIPAADTGGRPTVRRGDRGEFVRTVQGKIGVASDGAFGAATEAAVRQFQRNRNLVPDGIVGPKTWQALDAQTVAPAAVS